MNWFFTDILANLTLVFRADWQQIGQLFVHPSELLDVVLYYVHAVIRIFVYDVVSNV
jgi:hypothetical protein